MVNADAREKEVKAAQAEQIPAQLDRATVTPAHAVRSLEDSAEALTVLIHRAIASDGRIKNFRPDVAGFLAYLIAHDALLSGSRLSTVAVVDAELSQAGIDVTRLKKDLDAHSDEIATVLARNDAEARALALQGTPGIVVGRQLMPGGAELAFIQNLIAAARAAPR